VPARGRAAILAVSTVLITAAVWPAAVGATARMGGAPRQEATGGATGPADIDPSDAAIASRMAFENFAADKLLPTAEADPSAYERAGS
jgi:hypothetical protein